MEPRTTRSKQSSLASIDGLTLVELLVAMFVASIVVGAALALTMSSRSLFNVDRTRTEINQNLRGVMEMIGNDIRIAGERLNSFGGGAVTQHPLAAVQVINGNELIIRRNLLNETLALCQPSISAGTTTLEVARTSSGSGANFVDLNVHTHCRIDSSSDSNGNGVHDNLEAWRAFRAANGPAVGAFIYKPTNESDFFIYNDDPGTNLISRDASGSFQNAPYYVGQAIMILAEERHYRLVGDVLELVVNRDTTFRLANNVSSFDVRVVTADGASHSDYSASGSAWGQLASVELDITGLVNEGRDEVERTLSSSYFPRNILSN